MDLEDDVNKTPVTQFDEEENITTMVIPLQGMRDFLTELSREKGYLIFDALYSKHGDYNGERFRFFLVAFALGLEMGLALLGNEENTEAFLPRLKALFQKL